MDPAAFTETEAEYHCVRRAIEGLSVKGLRSPLVVVIRTSPAHLLVGPYWIFENRKEKLS